MRWLKSHRKLIPLVLIGFVGCSVLGFMRLREELQKIVCNINIVYNFDIPTSKYAEKNKDGYYLPMSSIPGRLYMDYDPEFWEETERYFCPSSLGEFNKLPTEAQFKNPSYVYFGYILSNESEMIAFLDAYPDFIANKVDFNNNLPAPEGLGTFGGNEFLRIHESMIEKYGEVAERIPIRFEIPDYTDEGFRFRHRDNASSVAFLGTAGTTIEYGDQFPLTEPIIERIGDIKRRFAK